MYSVAQDRKMLLFLFLKNALKICMKNKIPPFLSEVVLHVNCEIFHILVIAFDAICVCVCIPTRTF